MGQPNNYRGISMLLAVELLLLTVAGASFINAAENLWLTGEPLKQALIQKVGIRWSNIPTRRALQRLSQLRRVAIVLDRRVDPDQKIELQFDDVPLSEAFERIASRLGIGTAMLGPVAYFGPKATADKLRTISALRRDEINHLPAVARQKWVQTKAWKWDALSAPRDLVVHLTRSSGLNIDGVHQIPADLWAAVDLPPLSLSDRLTLIVSQFDLTFEPSSDGLSARLQPIPEAPRIERSYTVSGSSAEVAANLRRQKLLSDAEIRVVANKVIVRGRQEEHDIVDDILSGRGASKIIVAEGKKIYSLHVPIEKPVGNLLDQLGPALQLEIRIDRQAISAAGRSLNTLVQLDVKDVTADELLRAVLEPAGLKYRRHGDVIDVMPQ